MNNKHEGKPERIVADKGRWNICQVCEKIEAAY